MRKITVLVAALWLGGCATTGSPTTLAEFIKLTQSYAVQGCAFLPTVQTITAIFAQGELTSAFTIADAICKAVVVPPGARVARTTPRVGKVMVRGQFVR